MPGSGGLPGESVAAVLARSKVVLGVAVIERSGIAWSAGRPPDRLFQAGSISKPVTAIAALELAARGQVDLDGDVNQWLTSWRLPGSSQVSLRQLLGHTAGTGVPFFPGYPQGGSVPTLGQVLDGTPPSVTPAVRAEPGPFRYSGGGYAVVQQLIADVTGQPFADAVRTLVLEPLGMSRSTFEQPLPVPLRSAAARDDWHRGPLPFRLLRAISDECGWSGFRQPALLRFNGLPGVRGIACARRR
ncbi:MAG TPA: serine hydrolase domain-containing protein [Pseudonocardiaceae bacterium]|nr:serine hydrolase domain-containing protein [Pseudonocardiaceae bacterium]